MSTSEFQTHWQQSWTPANLAVDPIVEEELDAEGCDPLDKLAPSQLSTLLAREYYDPKRKTQIKRIEKIKTVESGDGLEMNFQSSRESE